MILVVARGTSQARDIQVRRLMIQFKLGKVPAGAREGCNGVYALVDPNAPGADEALAQLRSMPTRFEVVGDVPDDGQHELSRVRPAAAMAEAPDNVPPLVRVAFRRGWTLEDLWGCGKGNRWTADGGLSPRCGLSVAEMAACDPPDRWPSLASLQYPWEIPGWVPPRPGWLIPGVPSKAPKPLEPAQQYPQVQAVVPEDEHQPAVAADDGQPPEKPAAERASIEDAIQGASPEDREALADYGTAVELTAALDTAMSLDATGKKPSIAKLNYQLEKKSLPRAKTAHYNAFFNVLSALE